MHAMMRKSDLKNEELKEVGGNRGFRGMIPRTQRKNEIQNIVQNTS